MKIVPNSVVPIMREKRGENMRVGEFLSSALHSPCVGLGVGFSVVYYLGGLPLVVAMLMMITSHEVGHALALMCFGVFGGFGFIGLNPCVFRNGPVGVWQERVILLSGLLLNLIVCPFLLG